MEVGSSLGTYCQYVEQYVGGTWHNISVVGLYREDGGTMWLNGCRRDPAQDLNE
jgi:hypothetical protein